MSRILTIGVAQLGPITRRESRQEVVARLLAMMEAAARMGSDLIVYPEAALTAFFPHWVVADEAELDSYFEREMPAPAVAPLFAAGRRLGIAFHLGYAELTVAGGRKRRFNTSVLVGKDGAIIGSSLLGQNFSGKKYFHPRPSAAGPNGYDASASGGSNLGPTSQHLADLIKQRIADYRASNGLTENQPVPADAVTASGSGLDPHISPANALLQAARVAKARSLPPAKIQELIDAHTDKAGLGFLGAAGVNVLKLNLALDALTTQHP